MTIRITIYIGHYIWLMKKTYHEVTGRSPAISHLPVQYFPMIEDEERVCVFRNT